MTHTLRVSCVSVGQLRDPEVGEFDIVDGTISVKNYEDAHELVRKHERVSWIEDSPSRQQDDDSVDDDDVETCDVVMSNGEICGRELPCGYHS